MAKLDFPAASASPWVAPNNVIYTYIGTSPNGYWEANTANAATDLPAIFVERTGSTMTGALKLDNAGSVSLPDISFDGDVNTGLYSPSADSLGIAAGGINRLTIDIAGNVGIGTTSPSYRLQLGNNTSTSTATPEVISLGATYSSVAGSNPKLRLWDDTTNYMGIGVSSAQIDYITSGAYAHVFYTNGNESLRIDDVGNVGLGTNSPTSVLPNARSLTVSNIAGHAEINFVSSSANFSSIYFGDSTTGADRYSGYLEYSHPNDFMRFGTGTVERLRIDSSGNVGIGSTNPSGDGWSAANDLVINSTGNSGMTIKSGTSSFGQLVFNDAAGGLRGFVAYGHHDDYLGLGTAGAERMRIISSGLVGIGTTAPAATLHVTSSTGGASIQIGDSASAQYQYVNFGSTGTGHYGWQVGRAASGATFAPANGFYIYNAQTSLTEFGITPNGHVGIGTTSPYVSAWGPNAKQLHVSGSQYGVIHLTSTLYGQTWSHGIGGVSGTNFMAYDGSAGIHWLLIEPTSGITKMKGVYNSTTSSAANVHVVSTGQLYRSTSSIKYKTDVETLENQYADAILNCRPVWYRSVCDGDIVDKSRNKSEFGYYGFIAEEVADIDPRLVSWKTKKDVKNDDNWEVNAVDLDPSEYEAEGVNYTNFVPLLLNLIKRQKTELETLKEKVEALESA